MQKELHRCKSSGYGKMDRFGPWIWIELWNTQRQRVDIDPGYMESTTQPLHLSNESCLVDSNNTAAEVKKQHYHSVTNSTTAGALDGL